MKLLLISTPSRLGSSSFPPYACLAIMTYLKKHGQDDIGFHDLTKIEDIDSLLDLIVREKPTVIGLSAVVSTTYAIAKQLAADIRARAPEALIVLGGNLAASAEIILRKTDVDLCILGEGEIPTLEMLRHQEETGSTSATDFAHIRGMALLDAKGEFIANGYGRTVPVDEMYDVDWNVLEKDGLIDQYFPRPFENSDIPSWPWEKDARAYSPDFRDKRHANLYVGKGCPNRCSFCHRWTPGIRYIPVPILVQRIKELIKLYDVRFFSLMVEAFGVNKKWLNEFCESVSALGILWCVGGVRADTLTKDEVHMMRESGCAMLTYGHESGSQPILDVMEKNVQLPDNFISAENTIGAGLNTVIQCVIGMPGENNKTIRDTISFVRHVASLAPWQRPAFISVNYAMALPGTPIYEYGRRTGRFGQTQEQEEQYLLSMSNTEAADESSAINFTEVSRLDWLSWRDLIFHYTFRDYVLKHGVHHYETIVAMQTGKIPLGPEYISRAEEWDQNAVTSLNKKEYTGELPSRWKNILRARRFYHFFLPFPIIRLRILYRILKAEFKRHGFASAYEMLREHLRHKGLHSIPEKGTPLRKIVENLPPVTEETSAMLMLRKGR